MSCVTRDTGLWIIDGAILSEKYVGDESRAKRVMLIMLNVDEWFFRHYSSLSGGFF